MNQFSSKTEAGRNAPVARRWAMALATTFMLAASAASAQWSSGTSSWSGSRDGSSGWNDSDLKVIGLTNDQRLVRFDTDRPEDSSTLSRVNGLQAPDSALVGIDYRVQDGNLYGLGNGGGIYILTTSSGRATKVSQLTIALAGTSFGVDFNPAANALRITSDTGQNLRHPFAGATAGVTQNDGTLNYAGVVATGITGSAYVNNDLDANTGTTLFALDTNQDQVAVQSPPNAGTLVATGKLTVDAALPVGFDIYSTIRNGATVDNMGLASLIVAGKPGLYRIEMLTGKASLLGGLREALVDIAIPLNQL